MSDDAGESTGAEAGAAQATKKKGGMGPLIAGIALALLLGSGAAWAVMSGMVAIPGLDAPAAEDAHAAKKAEAEAAPARAYVALDPLTVTLGRSGAPRQLRIAMQIETTEPYAHGVEADEPRILDALNTLLRAVDEADLTEPAALDRLRAQMLRRIRIATDPTAIQDLLVTEYVIF